MGKLDDFLNIAVPIIIILFFIYIITPLRKAVANFFEWLGEKIPEWTQSSKEKVSNVASTGRQIIIYE